MPQRKPIQIGERFGQLTVLQNNLTILSSERTKYGCKCLCDCGKIVEFVLETSLRTGNTIACGCAWPKAIKLAAETRRKYSFLETSQRKIYSLRYEDGTLSFADFVRMSQFDCFYCGRVPLNKYGLFIYNGLDRIDNDKPHNIDNVITSCKYCNRAKRDLTIREFINHIDEMYSYRLLEYNNDYNNLQLPTLTNNALPIRIDFPIPEKIEIGTKVGFLTIVNRARRKSWLCKCICGKERIAPECYILNGQAKSCGENECSSAFGAEFSALRMVWAPYKREDISFDSFYELSQMNCFYCGVKPSNYARSLLVSSKGKFAYNGLDRINSSRGHTIDNVIPCCSVCNIMKNDRSLSDFNIWLSILNNRKNLILEELTNLTITK